MNQGVIIVKNSISQLVRGHGKHSDTEKAFHNPNNNFNIMKFILTDQNHN